MEKSLYSSKDTHPAWVPAEVRNSGSAEQHCCPWEPALTGWGWEEEEEAAEGAEEAAEAGRDFPTAGFASGVHPLHRSNQTNHTD